MRQEFDMSNSALKKSYYHVLEDISCVVYNSNKGKKDQQSQIRVSIPWKKLKNKITDLETVYENTIKINLNNLQYKLTIFGIFSYYNK